MGQGQLNSLHHDIPGWKVGESRCITVYQVPVLVTKCDDGDSHFGGTPYYKMSAPLLNDEPLETECVEASSVMSYASELAAAVVLTQLARGTALLVEAPDA